MSDKKIQFYDSTGKSTVPTRVLVNTNAITSAADVDLTATGAGGYVEYAATNSATQNVVQIPDSSSKLKDGLITQSGTAGNSNAGYFVGTTNIAGGLVSIATAGATTTLTVASKGTQIFTGVTTQTVALPDVTTLPQIGFGYRIINNSSGAVTVNSSGSNLVATVAAGASVLVLAQLLTGSTAASWNVITSGLNGLTVTATTGTLTITDGKTAAFSNSVTFAGTDSTTMTFPPASASVGYLNVPINSQSGDYSAVLGDSGKAILETGATKTITIPANSGGGSVAYPVGTALTFICTNATGASIAITTDTMTLANSTSTGTRTLAQNGMATAIKLTSTTWLISGTGLT